MKVLFLFSEYALHNFIIEQYHAARPNDSLAIVKVPLVIKGKGRFESAQRILPKASSSFVIAKAVEFLVLSAITLTPKILRRGPVFRRLRSIAKRVNASYFEFDNVMSAQALSTIAAQAPDVIVTLFHQILKEPLISVPRYGILNIHPGILPDFRGIQPYFWALASGASFSGATLHMIRDESIDTGDIVAATQHAINASMSVQLNYFLTACSAAQILPMALERVASAGFSGTPQSPGGAYYQWPTSEACAALRARGSSIVSFKDLFRILTGRYDSFKPQSKW